MKSHHATVLAKGKSRITHLVLCILVTLMLSVGTAAAHVPDSEIAENRNGRQLIIRTFTLPPDADPDDLIQAPFVREGFVYTHISIVKQEIPFESRQIRSESVTVETASDNLSVILDALDSTILFEDGEYSGTLALDHTTLRTEAAGFTNQSYTITDTRVIEGLDRNDLSFIPRTTIRNGVTLNLRDVEWSVQGTAVSGDMLVPTMYSAVAHYSAGASRRVATGYITTAAYTGEIVAKGIQSIVYTVTYIGEPVVVPTPRPTTTPTQTPLDETTSTLLPTQGPATDRSTSTATWLGWILSLLVIGAGAVAYLFLRWNTKVFNGSDLVGKLWLNASNPAIDLLGLRRYPIPEAVVEVTGKTARSLDGRTIKIRLRGGIVTHRIESTGDENYWFTVATQTEEETT